VSLAQSRSSQNQIDLTDVATAWGAFETINEVLVMITVNRTLRGSAREPKLIGTAVPASALSTGQRHWGSVSAECWAFDHRSLDSAVFHLLYTLDGLIASAEFGSVETKKA
jgi:hypothetical protein